MSIRDLAFFCLLPFSCLPGCCAPPELPNPGRVTLRRLSRTEYNNTVHDLLGTAQRPADHFPDDDVAQGFDNSADVLSTSPIHVELWQRAAQALVNEALGSDAPPGSSSQAAKILICTPAESSAEAERACALTILRRFTRLAWRRPCTDDELERLLALFAPARKEESDFVAGIKVALQGVLMSPHFLSRVELDPEPAVLAPHPLTPYELATRLSYFLWSSTPDETLLQHAEAGDLTSDAGLTAEVARMLTDERASALVDNFATQWLSLRALAGAETNPNVYPDFQPSLLAAMAEETRRFLREFFPQPGGTAQLSLQELPSAGFTYVNGELAQYYGLPAPVPGEWVRATLQGSARSGLLTQGSVLVVTSYPARTSPVRRGKWVLDQLLCTPPPPPPPNVIGSFGQDPASGTLRHRLEEHRKNPVCAACHTAMDPIGFALENFDGIGRYRTMDGGEPIDASGTLPGGMAFANAGELGALLSQDERLTRCAVQRMFAYALGRGPIATDETRLQDIHKRLAVGGFLAGELALLIAQSDAFRSRSPEGEPSPGGAR